MLQMANLGQHANIALTLAGGFKAGHTSAGQETVEQAVSNAVRAATRTMC